MWIKKLCPPKKDSPMRSKHISLVQRMFVFSCSTLLLPKQLDLSESFTLHIYRLAVLSPEIKERIKKEYNSFCDNRSPQPPESLSL